MPFLTFHGNRHADRGEIFDTARRKFDMRPARSGRRRHVDFGQQFAGLHGGLIVVDEKFIQAQRMRWPLLLVSVDFGVESDQTGSRVGEWIAGREIATHRAHITDARLGDFTKGFMEQGIVLLHGFR